MTIVEFLSQLRTLDIKLWVEADRLRYKSPSGVMTPALLSELAAHKQDIIDFLKETQTATPSVRLTIPTVPREKPLPLSFAQQRLWFLDQLEPNSATYNIPAAVRLSGSLNMTALEQSLNEIIRRHEALRTTFTVIDGQAAQVIAPELHISMPVIDLCDLPDDEREIRTRQLAVESAQSPFDLAHGPLMRATLLRLSETGHVLLLNTHHIVSDGWSIGVFIREIAPLYEACLTGQDSPLAELPIQYADFAHWQREWLRGEVLDAQLNYWKTQLGQAPTLELPTDRPRPPVKTYRGAHHTLSMAQSLADDLKTLSQQENVTLFMTLLTAFQVLLHRYSGQEDISIGSPIANRNRSQLEGLIGFFVNMLVLRTDCSHNPTFQELLQRVRNTTLGAYAHQDVPFEMVLETVQPERDMSRTPLFQVVFALQNAPIGTMKIQGLTFSPLEIENETAKFDLILMVTETGQGLQVELEYNTDLFDAATIQHLGKHFENLLVSVAAHPEKHITDLPMLTEIEQQQIKTWAYSQAEPPQNTVLFRLFEAQLAQHAAVNDTHAPISDAFLHTLFEAQVLIRPQQTAVITRTCTLTYNELACQTRRLGRWLRAQGAKPNMLVAVVMDKGWEQVVATLAILQAGAAYLPIDPALPEERIWHLLAHGQVQIALTHAGLAEKLNWPEAVQLVSVDQDHNWAGLDAGPLESIQQPTDLAYVIYTSGSTGLPKGVMTDHRGAVNTILDVNQRFNVQPTDSILALSALNFDLSVYDIFGLLAAGGTVVMPDVGTNRDPAHWADLMIREKITLWDTVPALMEMLVEYISDRPGNWLASLRVVMMSGDWIPVTLPDRIWKMAPQAQLISMGGATEASIWSILYPIQSVNPAWKSIPYGKPMLNQQFHVLNKALSPCPVWTPGDLYIGGIGLALGYWRDEEKTRERFITHPITGERLYKTGDLGRYLPDGNIEFLGREDFQVKIRGHRIELGEIEAALLQHPKVQTGIVLAVGERSDKKLVAYLVPEPGATSLEEDLRPYLRGKLPEYMVPGIYIFIDQLPLSQNGKIDRKALPVPDTTRFVAEEKFAPPRTTTEELLAGIWSQVLDVPQVGIYDNFFELGGHSLLATQVVSRLREVFRVELPLKTFFESATLSELAEHIETALQADQGLTAPPMIPVPRSGALPLSFAQQRLWFLDRLEPNSPAYNIPAAVRISGALNVAVLEQSLNEIVRRHEALRTTFTSVDGQTVQTIDPTMSLPLTLVDLTGLSENDREERVRSLTMEDARRPFDLVRGPLVRATLLRLDEREHALLLNMHHIVSDGWSMGIFIQEIATLYSAYISGQPSPLPDLPIQYADFAVWQRTWLQGDVLAAQLSYWKNHLSHAPILDLPTDRPRPSVQTYRGAHLAFALSKPLTETLKNLGQQENATLFMTLLAAFQTLLYRYAGQEDISIGVPIANRNRSETEGLIGFFVNTLVLRSNLSGAPTFRALLQQVREVTLGAYAHQDVPFEMVVEALQPERDMSRTPLFQVMFSLQNTPIENIQLPELTLKPVEVEDDVAKFDLTLNLGEGNEGLAGDFEYNLDLFIPETIQRMVGHFQTLLESLTLHPEQRLGDLAMLTLAERNLLADWNQPQSEYAHSLSVHQMFEAQVERSPQAVAVAVISTSLSPQDAQGLTYHQLNQRANQVARYLRRQGIGPETFVGLCLERSPEMIVALLGILKAGGAYVPMDAHYPAERLSAMIDDTRPRVILTQQHLVEHLPAHSAITICLDTDWPVIAQEDTANPNYAPDPDNLAYAIYTSGSTGKPKGVLITHRSLAHFSRMMQQKYALQHGERVLQFASISFDTSAEEIYPSLLSGATLVLRTEQMLHSMDAFLETCAAQNIQVVDLPTAFWHVLVIHLEAEKRVLPAGLRLMIIGGERALPERLVTWQHLMAGQSIQLVNTYGASEATAITTWGALANETDGNFRREIAIGKPIPGISAYILDAELRPVPVGVPGKLFIGGLGLARGYFGQPALTAERFIPNPFSSVPGERLYATGDLARYLPDGSILYLGRRDHQVKVRGFRIELGEIESALRQYVGIADAAVLLRETRLVAYLACPAEKPDRKEIQTHLAKKLPQYMVPAVFVFTSALPLSSNGKINRSALLNLEDTETDQTPASEMPQTDVEKKLVDIWQQLLEVDNVGRDDNFFSKGGHSLVALQMVDRIRQDFDVELPVSSAFDAQTIADLAQRIDALYGLETTAVVTPIARQPRGGEFPLSIFQQKLWSLLHPTEPNPAPTPSSLRFLKNLFSGRDETGNPWSEVYPLVASLCITGVLDQKVLFHSLELLSGRHEMLRTRFVVREGQVLQDISEKTTSFEFQMVDLQNLSRDAAETETQSLIAHQKQKKLDVVGDESLWRVILIRLTAHNHRLVIALHPLIADLLSANILVRDLAVRYDSLLSNKPAMLPELPVQYADYVVWQQGILSKDALQSQLDFWKLRLKDFRPLFPLRRSQNGQMPRVQHAVSHGFVLAKAQVETLKAVSRQQGVPWTFTLAATFQALLYNFTGAEDIAVAVSVPYRPHKAVKNGMGPFSNYLTLRTSFIGEPDFSDVLRQLREATAAMLENQDLPFESVMKNLSSNQVQALLVVEDKTSGLVQPPGIAFSKLDITGSETNFELCMCLQQSPSELSGTITYNPELFDGKTIEDLVTTYQMLLENILHAPERSLKLS